ncbi:hypothetical protein VIBNIAM115_400013 [Vibrio nigripulchritudo AM115]|nr:hypothetical protein VIBNIAM115_400013 [Vibrio nigripulchritudo AM115]
MVLHIMALWWVFFSHASQYTLGISGFLFALRVVIIRPNLSTIINFEINICGEPNKFNELNTTRTQSVCVVS